MHTHRHTHTAGCLHPPLSAGRREESLSIPRALILLHKASCDFMIFLARLLVCGQNRCCSTSIETSVEAEVEALVAGGGGGGGGGSGSGFLC